MTPYRSNYTYILIYCKTLCSSTGLFVLCVVIFYPLLVYVVSLWRLVAIWLIIDQLV